MDAKQVLEHWKEKRSELSEIISSLCDGEKVRISKDYFGAYETSGLSYAIKSIPIRAIFGDSSITHAELSEEEFIRLCFEIVKSHPKDLLDDNSSMNVDDFPKSMIKRLKIRRKSSGNQLLDSLHKKYLSDPEKYPFLREVYDARFLSDEACRSFIEKGANTGQTSFYLETGDKDLNLRNMVMYMSNIIWAEKEPKLLQVRVPRAISKRFNISNNSLPELQALSDILFLRYKGLIKGQWKSFEDLDQLTERCSWFLTPEKSEKIKDIPGRYATSIYFNTRRISKKFKNISYEGADVLDHSITHLREHAGTDICNLFYSAYKKLEHEFSGIGIRDLANIIFHAEYMRKKHKLKPSESLPPVARFRMGQKEPEYTGEKRSGKSRARQKTMPREVRMPLWDIAFSEKPKFYVLNPMFAGNIPEDALVYVPKGFEQMYENIPSRIISVEVKTKLGSDPCEELLKKIEGTGIYLK